MKIAKVVESTLSPNENGEYVVYAQVLEGNLYQYASLHYRTYREAKYAKDGDFINRGRVKVICNTKNRR